MSLGYDLYPCTPQGCPASIIKDEMLMEIEPTFT